MAHIFIFSRLGIYTCPNNTCFLDSINVYLFCRALRRWAAMLFIVRVKLFSNYAHHLLFPKKENKSQTQTWPGHLYKKVYLDFLLLRYYSCLADGLSMVIRLIVSLFF